MQASPSTLPTTTSDTSLLATAAQPADAPRPVMLRCEGVSKRFGSVTVVSDISLTVYKGELLALLGPSGCGKTTMLRLIAGFEEPDSGTIEVAGRVVVGPDGSLPPERRRIGMVFQDYALFPHLSVEKNVAFGLQRGGNRDERVEHALEMVGLGGLGDRMPYQLSGGQQQRVALARALAPQPEIVLLDEPFSNLDPELRVQVRGEVREILRKAGATAILVTHDQEEALSLADRIAVMFGGRIVQTASPEAVYHRPASRDVAAFVGDAQFVAGVASGRRVQTVLGELPAANPGEGPVDVLVRPEMVRLRPDAEGNEGTVGVVQAREFFGHDQVLTVELADGTKVNSRIGSYGGFRVGDRVRVSVRGAVLLFAPQP